ncbi:hypothetical protein VP501E541_P0158 [Vibrio phage 501E54-1]|nr:hypothetical protein VP501E541_P0158 [Vibrio phage 501E54-1]
MYNTVIRFGDIDHINNSLLIGNVVNAIEDGM